MLSNNQITQINDKKVCERINCPKCNKPNMSKKNISAHYKAGCSGIWDQYDQKKIKQPKEPKEKKPRQPRKSKNKKLSFSCSDFIDFTNWLIENQVILDEDDQDQFHECYQQFKNNQEAPKPPMIIKINLPSFNFKKEEVEESVEEVVEEVVQFDNIYPEEESFKNENEMIIPVIHTPSYLLNEIKNHKQECNCESCMVVRCCQENIILDKIQVEKDNEEARKKGYVENEEGDWIKPTLMKKIKLSTLRKPRKEKPVTEFIIPADSWLLKSNKPKIDPEDEFFLEDENIEKEFPDNTEEQIKLRLNKFMERWSDTEIKNYSNDQKKRIGHIIRNQKKDLNGLNYMTNIELFKNKSKYNFIIRNLINLINLKTDLLYHKDLSSEEEFIKLINEFDKTKFIKKYNDKFNHWADRAIDTYQNPKSNEWTITTRERPEPTDD